MTQFVWDVLVWVGAVMWLALSLAMTWDLYRLRRGYGGDRATDAYQMGRRASSRSWWAVKSVGVVVFAPFAYAVVLGIVIHETRAEALGVRSRDSRSTLEEDPPAVVLRREEHRHRGALRRERGARLHRPRQGWPHPALRARERGPRERPGVVRPQRRTAVAVQAPLSYRGVLPTHRL